MIEHISQIRFADIDEAQQVIIKRIMPNLRDFALYHVGLEFRKFEFFFANDTNAYSVKSVVQTMHVKARLVMSLIIDLNRIRS